MKYKVIGIYIINTMNNIIWKNIPINEFNDNYEISNYGDIKKISNNKLLSILISSTGYKSIRLSSNGFRKTFQIHSLVAETFLIKPKHKKGHKIIVKFIDNDKNNIKPENLVYEYRKINIINDIQNNNNDNNDYINEITINNFIGKKIKNYPNYLVSKQGQIFSINKNNLKDIENNDNGYSRIRLFNGTNNIGKQFYVHRLVAEAYIENPNNYKYVNHIDLNKHNNTIENLEWCTASMNMQHNADNK